MTPIRTLRALRRAQRNDDAAAAVALLQSLGGTWRLEHFPKHEVCQVTWWPTSDSWLCEEMELGGRSATATTPTAALAAVLTEIAAALFRARVAPLMTWLARVAASALLGV